MLHGVRVGSEDMVANENGMGHTETGTERVLPGERARNTKQNRRRGDGKKEHGKL